MVIYTMRKVINISIPEPCHESWEKMTPQGKDRHCAVCDKTVIDFTKTTDEQIITTFEQKGNLCGRFKSTQLNRDIVLSRKERNSYLSLVASGLFAFLSIGTQDAQAQGKTKIVQTDTTSYNKVKGKIATSVLQERVVSGTVTSTEDGLPLPGVSIVIKGSTSGVQTDFDGNFSIKVKHNSILEFNYIGYKPYEIKVSNLISYNIKLSLEEDYMGEIVVIAGYSNYSENSYVCSPEELEQKRINKERNENRLAFYSRKHKEEKEARKLKRQLLKNGEIKRTVIGSILYKLTNVFRSK